MKHDAEIFSYDSDDGLTLAGRRHGSLTETALPLVCLPGLTRNAKDFDALAAIVRSGDAPRPVIAFDYRGRGASDRSAQPEDYNVLRETQDVLSGLAQLGIDRAIFLGTSRGALILHVMATIRGDLLAGVILNDAGPRIEWAGIDAIRTYLTAAMPTASFEDAARSLARVHGPTFPALGPDDFLRMAKASHVEREGQIIADYDPRLIETLGAANPNRPAIELWEQFEALCAIPLMVIRGEHSTLLSRQTVDQMAERHPGLVRLNVVGQGHPPLLETPAVADAVLRFCRSVDDRRQR